mmetsp:Transcript_8135/g.15091  ORF Transcript_8135/g.15091 Transcript_8135/m.15091 type:complete len:212 (-) Transcript_8135:46-681(-)
MLVLARMNFLVMMMMARINFVVVTMMLMMMLSPTHAFDRTTHTQTDHNTHSSQTHAMHGRNSMQGSQHEPSNPGDRIIPKQAQNMLNSYMRGLFRLKELQKLSDEKKQIVSDMNEVDDLWEIGQGSWTPQVYLGNFAIYLDANATRKHIDRRRMIASRDKESMEKEKDRLTNFLHSMLPSLKEWFRDIIKLETPAEVLANGNHQFYDGLVP